MTGMRAAFAVAFGRRRTRCRRKFSIGAALKSQLSQEVGKYEVCGGATEFGSEVTRGNLIPSKKSHDQLEKFVHDPYILWHIYMEIGLDRLRHAGPRDRNLMGAGHASEL